MSTKEIMNYDVLIIGAGPAGLATACRLMQKSQERGKEISVCIVEKGSEVGAHILSGAVIETRSIDELFPNWEDLGAPIKVPVTQDDVYMLFGEKSSLKVPSALVPKSMHNEGNYIVSLGQLSRWLAEQAEALGVDVFPGFSADELIIEDNVVKGIVTGDMGLDSDGKQKDTYAEGMELRAPFTVVAEGARGHLGKQVIEQYKLGCQSDVQHYGLGIKELWEIPAEQHQLGRVVHTGGWPLDHKTGGGSFMYHTENNQVAIGLIVDLAYSNPYLSPFDEFQRMKHHSVFSESLQGGKRISYGARAISKGGINSLPEMCFPGGLLIGCNAGTLNFSKIKGVHTAMKSGMIAAETIFQAIESTMDAETVCCLHEKLFKESWLYDELVAARNFGPAMHKFGLYGGSAFNYIDQNVFSGRLPFTLRDTTPDYATTKKSSQSKLIEYPKPDNKLSFDKLSSVFLSSVSHVDNQPCHLVLQDPDIPLRANLPQFDEPAVRYCPAGVYEIINENGEPQFHINSQNCLHCKTCDIKDPAQNIRWTTPEGGGGPNYPNM